MQKQINELFLCEAIEHSENLVSFCQNKGILLRTSLETIGINHSQIETDIIGNTTFLTLQQSPLFGWGQFSKRLFDIIFASIILSITFPYILFVFYKQKPKKIEFVNGINNSFLGYNNFILLQLSILKKDISVVGPKLLTKNEYLKLFKTNKNIASGRFILRPGLFSPQCLINKNSNYALNLITTETKYIRNWNFYRLFSFMLSGRNAKKRSFTYY